MFVSTEKPIYAIAKSIKKDIHRKAIGLGQKTIRAAKTRKDPCHKVKLTSVGTYEDTQENSDDFCSAIFLKPESSTGRCAYT
jgi:hypothetical protein